MNSTSQSQPELALFFTDGVSLATWDEGGMLPREVALYKRLVQLGARVEFVTYGGSVEREYALRLGGIRLRHNAFNLPPKLYKTSLQWLPPQGNIFKSNQISGAEVGLAAARKAGARFIARCGYLLSFIEEQTHGADSPQAQHARKLEQSVFRQADQIVVTTPVIAARVREQYSLPMDKIGIIPNYVETDRFTPHSVEKHKFRIGFVGRLAWEKNLKTLAEAANGLDAELVLVGEGPLKPELQAIAAAPNANLHVLGRRDNADLPAFLNSCDLFVLPSLYEGHPKALLEAMACGLPVIGTRVSGIQELLQDGHTGLLCGPDAASLRDAIQRMMADAGLRARLGKAARSYVLKNFSLDRVAELEMNLLQDMASTNA